MRLRIVIVPMRLEMLVVLQPDHVAEDEKKNSAQDRQEPINRHDGASVLELRGRYDNLGSANGAGGLRIPQPYRELQFRCQSEVAVPSPALFRRQPVKYSLDRYRFLIRIPVENPWPICRLHFCA
jgi:hypothetical protein